MSMENEMIERPKLILFDVYETLLDMSDLERKVNSLLDSKRGFALWFELCMQYCFVENCTLHFNDFTSIARATLQMAGKTLGANVSETQANDVLRLMLHLPVNDGVPAGLSLIADNGFRIAALTNSSQKTVSDRMERTGLISYFEMVMSAEHVKKYKPCKEVYEWAAKKLNLLPAEILLVSCHGWDIAGGANAGMRTAYLEQKKQILYPLAPQPDLTCKNLDDLGTQLGNMKN